MLHSSTSTHINNGGQVSNQDQTYIETTKQHQLQHHENGGTSADQAASSSKIPPQATFEKTSFDQLICQYDLKHDLPPTIELTQAFLLTQNMKETASKVSGLTAGGSAYHLKNDYVGDAMRLSDAMQSVNRLLGNLGTSDKASNFLLEQRKLMRAQERENKDIRQLIDEKIIDGMEYVRQKELIAQTKSRVHDLLDEQFTSDEERSQNGVSLKLKESVSARNGGRIEGDSLTQEDSEEAVKNRLETEQRIKSIISQLREDAQEYLVSKGDRSSINLKELPLQKICFKLRQNERYRKRRESKAIQKGLLDTLQNTSEQLKKQLEYLNNQLKNQQVQHNQSYLERLVSQYEQFQGIEKRLNVDGIDKSVSEIDSYPINQRAYEIQNVLLEFCGINSKGQQIAKAKSKRDMFGRILKIPTKSQQLQQYQDQNNNNESSKSNNEGGNKEFQPKKKHQELVKMIGLEPEKLFQSLDKYKIRVDRMPKFSNVFERAEPIIPGLGMTVAGSLIASNQGGQMTFARVDGRNVISLQFNPYEAQDPQKKKIYDQAMKDIVDQREKIKSISKQAREKQEQSNIKRAWINIVKKDIPKAYRQFQKYQTDQDANNKKQSQNCLKEVRKKAIKTQRLGKETILRAKKLTKEMINFWKKRDKEMADLKRKKEKIEKEMKRKQEEEKEALLQKKRLEFIMQQSEIYAHFMSKKLGLSEEQNKQKATDLDEEKRDNVRRVQIDDKQARNQVASIINENLSRVGQFDRETIGKQDSRKQINEDELEVDKFDNPDVAFNNVIQAPSCFLGKLKDYQLKGMRWLDNLYDQGINGILADEMGLGKTIQAISLLAHLYENKGVWGPFMIIVPVTTLHNWQNELAKFCPSLKVLPYFGSPEERKKLGKFLDPKNLYNPSMRINVLLTSYNLIVNNQKDQAKLLRVKWHYMILDEAQAIKNNLSRRWKVLLQFQTRNRLLLTGTPIQNSMAELWALLHFIMPKLFDSHEQFQEWFSKDIEQHSFNNQGEINKHQLRRLHLVLKPFMLRRLKKDVESEIGPKIEYEKYCDMTHRQRVLYHRIKSKISTKDLFQLVENKAKMENLMNLVMQFRKVCNHPELFERRIGRIPFSFKELQHGMLPNPAFQSIPDLRVQIKNPITFDIPKLIFDECFLSSDNKTKFFRKIRSGVDEAFQEVGIETHMNLFNIFGTINLYKKSYENTNSTSFSTLRLLMKGNNWSCSELSYLFVADPLMKQIALMHFYYQKFHKRIYENIHNNDNGEIFLKHLQIGQARNSKLDINIIDHINRDYSSSLIYRHNKVYDDKGKLEYLPPLVTDDLNVFTNFSKQLKQDLDIFVYAALAEPINYTCRSGTFNRFLISTINSSLHKKALLGNKFKPRYEIHLGRVGKDRSSFLQHEVGYNAQNSVLPNGYPLIEKGILDDVISEKGACILDLPNYSRLVTDCAKMQYLDKLLTELSRDNHRVLIFCQMTRMLDILEDFLCWKKYTYFRMDGSTSIPDRRYMVEEYQKNPTIFAFLLSTRAGGLGVNLTAADTVIFYDNDWNPTMDAQATDRAHRIGQTKKVSVYRLVTRRTVEEKILKRARQKQSVQSTVYGGNALKADVFNALDVVDMLLDEQEQKDLKQSGQFLRTKRLKKQQQSKPVVNSKDISTRLHRPQLNNHPDQNLADQDIQDDDDNKYGGNGSSNQFQNHSSRDDKKRSNDHTPQKQSSSLTKKNSDEGPKKPGRKPNPDKIKTASSQQPMNIFSTVKSNGPAADTNKNSSAGGPFSIFKTTTVQKQSSNVQQQAVNNQVYDEEDEYEEDDDQQNGDEYGDEEQDAEELEGEDLFSLLKKKAKALQIEYKDDENPIPQDMDEDDEGGSKQQPKNKKDANNMDEDDDMMVDDY